MAKRRSPNPDTTILPPHPERGTHDGIERLSHAIKDTEGRVSLPFRSIDILRAMERRGAITREMGAAGETFRERFNDAHINQLRAADFMRSASGKGQDPGFKSMSARDYVWRSICAVGGISSAGGACLWHVVGLEQSLKEWALEQGWAGRRVSPETASGILVGTLGALVAHNETEHPASR